MLLGEFIEAIIVYYIKRNTHIPKHITLKSFNFTKNLSVFANLLVTILNQKERHLLDWTLHKDVVRLTLDITIIVSNTKGISLVIIVVE